MKRYGTCTYFSFINQSNRLPLRMRGLGAIVLTRTQCGSFWEEAYAHRWGVGMQAGKMTNKFEKILPVMDILHINSSSNVSLIYWNRPDFFKVFKPFYTSLAFIGWGRRRPMFMKICTIGFLFLLLFILVCRIDQSHGGASCCQVYEK